jgi:hypothetical protein
VIGDDVLQPQEDDPMNEKNCVKCGATKPLSEYYANYEMADGRLNSCRECCRRAAREHRATNREHYAAYERMRNARPERREKQREYQRRACAKSPEKKRARRAVYRALRARRLTRQPCEVCGSLLAQAHHDDYSKPREVRWLCFKHHRERAHGQVVTSDWSGFPPKKQRDEPPAPAC